MKGNSLRETDKYILWTVKRSFGSIPSMGSIVLLINNQNTANLMQWSHNDGQWVLMTGLGGAASAPSLGYINISWYCTK